MAHGCVFVLFSCKKLLCKQAAHVQYQHIIIKWLIAALPLNSLCIGQVTKTSLDTLVLPVMLMWECMSVATNSTTPFFCIHLEWAGNICVSTLSCAGSKFFPLLEMFPSGEKKGLFFWCSFCLQWETARRTWITGPDMSLLKKHKTLVSCFSSEHRTHSHPVIILIASTRH